MLPTPEIFQKLDEAILYAPAIRMVDQVHSTIRPDFRKQLEARLAKQTIAKQLRSVEEIYRANQMNPTPDKTTGELVYPKINTGGEGLTKDYELRISADRVRLIAYNNRRSADGVEVTIADEPDTQGNRIIVETPMYIIRNGKLVPTVDRVDFREGDPLDWAMQETNVFIQAVQAKFPISPAK